MDSRKIVFRETAIIAAGELILSAAMVGVFAGLGYFKMNVLWGALGGCAIMIANYFLMALVVSVATDKATQGENKRAKSMVQISSLARLLLMGLAVILGIKLGANTLAITLPLLFARPTLMIAEFFRKKGD